MITRTVSKDGYILRRGGVKVQLVTAALDDIRRHDKLQPFVYATEQMKLMRETEKERERERERELVIAALEKLLSLVASAYLPETVLYHA